MDIKNSAKLEREIAALLNKFSAENDSGTPDFILAKFLFNCLENFNQATKERKKWDFR